jgi:hypothetical protein
MKTNKRSDVEGSVRWDAEAEEGGVVWPNAKNVSRILSRSFQGTTSSGDRKCMLSALLPRKMNGLVVGNTTGSDVRNPPGMTGSKATWPRSHSNASKQEGSDCQRPCCAFRSIDRLKGTEKQEQKPLESGVEIADEIILRDRHRKITSRQHETMEKCMAHRPGPGVRAQTLAGDRYHEKLTL